MLHYRCCISYFPGPRTGCVYYINATTIIHYYNPHRHKFSFYFDASLANIYLFKADYGDTREMYEICS